MQVDGDRINSAIKEFCNNHSYLEEYKGLSVDGQNIMVRLFEYIPEIDEGEESKILMPTLEGDFVNHKVATQSKVYPIGMVIHAGEHTGKKQGDIVIAKHADVLGTRPNPEYVQYIAQHDMKGAIPKPPKGMAPVLSNLDFTWGQNRFVRPWAVEEDLKRQIFVVSTARIQATMSYD